MPSTSHCLYWIGNKPSQLAEYEHVVHFESINQLPDHIGGAICFDFDDLELQNEVIKQFYSKRWSWSWSIFTTQRNALSDCLTDGVFDEASWLTIRREAERRLTTTANVELLEPIIGWLSINRERNVMCSKDIRSTSLYRYPIIEALYPELDSTYRFVLAEKSRGILDSVELIDRIRVCSKCNSGHLNYVDVCPSCSSIDIESQSSLHCFTCGHVDDQQSFLRRGKLECPKCMTQLRHIGVDYDRPLESHKCNTCSSLFVEASTLTQCMSCDSKVPVNELVVRKIYQYRLGETGEYIFQHGKSIQAPQLSIKGKVESGYFQNLLSWVNKVALRHKEEHLLLALYLPSLADYGKQYGDAKLFALIEQITSRLSSLFRDTDICCQYKQDVLLVLMPKTRKQSLSAVQLKLSELSELIEEDDFELNVHARSLPDPALSADVESWLEALLRDIYAAG